MDSHKIRRTSEETQEQKDKRVAEAEKRRLENEEADRLAVPRAIETLRKEAADKIIEAEALEARLIEYPNLRKQVGRWNKVVYYSKDVNSLVSHYDMRHNCGCCNDSPLEVWPYLETPLGKIYSDPPIFRVGERGPYGGDIPNEGWVTIMKEAGIGETIIETVRYHFKKSADETRKEVEEIYNNK